MKNNNNMEIDKLKPLRVLIVEDVEDDALLVIRELVKNGYQPDYWRVEKAAEMKKALSEKTWDIILCDYKLPKFSALKAIELLKETGRDIPLIVISGTIGEETAVECMKAGAHDYFMKGKLSRLAPAIERELKEAAIRRKQKQTEAALLESEEKYRLVVENAQEAIIITQDLKVVFTNSAAVDQIGYPEEIFLSHPFTDFIHPADRNIVVDNHLKRLKGEKIPPVQSFRIIRKDGDIRWVNLNAAIISWRGKPAVLNFLSDITEQKKAEETLRQSEEKYRLIFEHSPIGLLYFDKNGVIVACNDNFVKIIGSSREALIGVNMLNLPDKGVVSAVRQALGGSPGLYEDMYHSVTAPKITPLRALFTPMNAEGGLVQGGVGIIEDVTERKAIENERKISLEKSRKALSATVGAMATMVETRDPYTAGHQQRVAHLAQAIAAEMKLAEEQIEGIHMAGTIHDIGKISVPAEILTKPGKLTELEYSLVKTHPRAGYDILKDIEFPWPLAKAVLQHHERMDGSGYPEGLKGEAILPEARILAVADVVEAIASHRPYRPARGIEAAIEEIYKNRLILYDSNVVDACIKLFREKGYKLI
jgi:PAS domain S-box-containing protein